MGCKNSIEAADPTLKSFHRIAARGEVCRMIMWLPTEVTSACPPRILAPEGRAPVGIDWAVAAPVKPISRTASGPSRWLRGDSLLGSSVMRRDLWGKNGRRIRD